MKHLNRIFEDDEVDNDDVIENLLSILRKFIRNAGFDPYVSYDDDAIVVQFILNKVESMPSIMKVMELLNKLHTDILIQYECEFDLAETTDDMPLITASFYYNEGIPKKKKQKSSPGGRDDGGARSIDDYLDKYPF